MWYSSESTYNCKKPSYQFPLETVHKSVTNLRSKSANCSCVSITTGLHLSAFSRKIRPFWVQICFYLRLVFFARTFGDLQIERALPLLNLLDVLTVNNASVMDRRPWNSLIFSTKAYYQACNCLLISFSADPNTPVRYIATTPDMHLDHIFSYLILVPSLANKQLFIHSLGQYPYYSS